MPYPEQLVTPMRQELTRLGVDELRTAEDVDQAMEAAEASTTLAIINSVCGCAAANARPAVAMAKGSGPQPDNFVTVFAGQDLQATARLREHLAGIPPSSPFMALFKDGTPVFLLERKNIEGRSASAIAQDLTQAFATFCGTNGTASADGDTAADQVTTSVENEDKLPSTFKSIL